MGLAVSNIRLLTLTSRKADCEYNISINAMEKMALTREQSDLSTEYYAKLKSKNIAYYANGKYNKMDYNYLMGSGLLTATNITLGDTAAMKKDCSMILTDTAGRVVMSDSYANTLKKVLGDSCIDAEGRGGTFSMDKIPAIIADIAGEYCSEQDVKTVIDGGKIQSNYNVTVLKTMSQETVETGKSHDNTDAVTEKIAALVNFFYPIFQAAAANGWTTEYNQEMKHNDNYISDALVSGIFELAQVNSQGGYEPDTSLTYFTTSNLVLERTDSSVREEITAWYNAEKEKINEKESWLDIEMQDLSTELEAINTEIESINSFIQDSMSVFEWGQG